MKIEDLMIAANTNLRREKLLASLEKASKITGSTNVYFYYQGYTAQDDRQFWKDSGLLEDSGDFFGKVLREALVEKIKSELEEIDKQLMKLGVEF